MEDASSPEDQLTIRKRVEHRGKSSIFLLRPIVNHDPRLGVDYYRKWRREQIWRGGGEQGKRVGALVVGETKGETTSLASLYRAEAACIVTSYFVQVTEKRRTVESILLLAIILSLAICI